MLILMDNSKSLEPAYNIEEKKDFSVRPNKFKVEVFFKEGLSLQNILEETSGMKDPQVYLWYIGCNGFRTESASFYKDLLTAFLERKIKCNLYDLTAWGAFKETRFRLEQSNKNVERINSLALGCLQAIKSSDFFLWLKNENNTKTSEYLKSTVLVRKEIFKPSESREDTKVTLGEVFNRNCPVFEKEYDRNSAKAYSAVQYIEGYYLIQKAVETRLDQEIINIVFALPNDEWKFYAKEEGCFANDIHELLQATFGDKLKGKRVNIFFSCFKYQIELGKVNQNDRPYNEGGTIKKAKKGDIVYCKA